MLFQLVKQMAKEEGVTEALKRQDQMLSSLLVNLENIRSTGANHEIIMTDGTRFPVSMRKYNGFKTAYLEFCRRRVVKV